MANDHDSSYKYLFSRSELVRDLIMGFVPDEWLHGLDYSTLEIVHGSRVGWAGFSDHADNPKLFDLTDKPSESTPTHRGCNRNPVPHKGAGFFNKFLLKGNSNAHD